jgi:hypothetical protein
LFDSDHPRIADLRGLDAYDYREVARNGDFTGELIRGWTPLYLDPFRGVTEDDTLREGMHPLTPAEPGEEAPVAAMVAAAQEPTVRLVSHRSASAGSDRASVRLVSHRSASAGPDPASVQLVSHRSARKLPAPTAQLRSWALSRAACRVRWSRSGRLGADRAASA